ncbi:MAG: EamA family transporter [Opitutaceae bacterium]|nr:EamA family transporter [Opitutaceae bacterium]|tara:strand:- start:1591 stop:2454 length:864 start_codon:yes stop_codon:yes gene_type:complete
MGYLILVSLIWAFSFGLIKTYLTGLDPLFVGAVRIGIALLVFLPFLKVRGLPFSLLARFFIIGGVQYGLMYGSYIYTYQFLEAHKIALFTITTPLFVSVLDDFFEKRFRYRYLVYAAISVIGASITYYKATDVEGALVGVALLQFSNFCFAVGQVYYRRTLSVHETLKPLEHFGILYAGGMAVSLLLVAAGTDLSRISVTGTQWIVLIFLGILASGIGFFLWNYGATKTNAGSLATMNNLKIPLAVAVSLLFYEVITQSALIKLLLGGGVIVCAVYLSERYARRLPA